MLELNQLGGEWQHNQAAAPVESRIPGKGGSVKDRVFITAPGVNLKDAETAEKMHYAVAGKVITRDQAQVHVNKKNFLQKDFVLLVQKEEGGVEYLLVNKASFAKRHDLSLREVNSAAGKTAKNLKKFWKEQGKNVDADIERTKDLDSVKLAEKQITREAEAEAFVEKFVDTIHSPDLSKEDKIILIESYRKGSEDIPNKKLKRDFKKLLNDVEKGVKKDEDLGNLIKNFEENKIWWSTGRQPGWQKGDKTSEERGKVKIGERKGAAIEGEKDESELKLEKEPLTSDQEERIASYLESQKPSEFELQNFADFSNFETKIAQQQAEEVTTKVEAEEVTTGPRFSEDDENKINRGINNVLTAKGESNIRGNVLALKRTLSPMEGRGQEAFVKELKAYLEPFEGRGWEVPDDIQDKLKGFQKRLGKL